MQPMPSSEELLLESPLYRRFERDDSSIRLLRDMLGPIDVHCPLCRKNSVFSREDQTPGQAMAGVVSTGHDGLIRPDEFKPNTFSMHFKCSRVSDHKLHFHFRVDHDSIMKYGEYPSRIDRLHPDLQKYEKSLGDYFNDYRSAMMFQSHGFGIGAFVYLRRVFERVLRDVATKKYEATKSWSYDDWRKGKRIEDVIKDLSAVLPDFLLDNKVLYGVLSKGIHDLDEEECLTAFPVVRAATEEILDDIIVSQQKAKRREGVSKQLQDVQSKLGKS